MTTCTHRHDDERPRDTLGRRGFLNPQSPVSDAAD